MGTNEPAGIWIRVSSGGQDEGSQLPDIERHCTVQGYRVERRYELHDRSASKGEQQAKLDAMISDMREGAIRVLVCWHDDRLERRGGMDLLKILADVKDAGGRVESTQQGRLGLETLDDRISSFVSGEIANQKSVHLAEQVKIGLAATRRNMGVYTSLPWGYEAATGARRNKTASPIDECLEYWPQVLQRCIDGDSCRTIARWLDSKGVKPTNGGNWNEDVIGRLIRNPVYCGHRLGWDNAPLLKNEAVVSVDLWKRANEALTNRPKRGPQAPAKNLVKPMLAKLKCARCGSPMYRIHAGSRDRDNFYYRCAGSGPQRKGCGNMVPLGRLERMVAVRFLAWNDKPYQIREWVEGRNWDADIADLSIAISELAKNPTADRWLERMGEMQTQLIEYERKNREEREGGDWDYTDAHNADGSILTIGQHFFDLDSDGRREYLTTHDIRAERTTCCGGIRVVIDGREDVAHKDDCPTEAQETP
jgi:DNA invertase Pin-like site-specific DNA recombinase